MDKNPLDKGLLSENSVGIGPVSRAMQRQRAIEVAIMDGRSAQDVNKSDWEQAKRELAGDPDGDPNEAILEAAPESVRDLGPGSESHQVPDAPNEDEDEEGRSESAQLVEEGVNEAERDQMLESARDTIKKDRTEK